MQRPTTLSTRKDAPAAADTAQERDIKGGYPRCPTSLASPTHRAPAPVQTDHTCTEILAGEHRLRIRCHRCSVDYNNERRRAHRAGVPFGIPKEQLKLPITIGEQAEQATF